MGSEQDHAGRIQEARRRLATDGPPRVRSGGDFERVSLPVADGDVLRDLLLAENPGTVIEIGLAYGSSALAIAEALVASGSNEARHVIVDAYQKAFHDSGRAAIAGAGLAGICSLVEERSQLALSRLLADGFVADAAFVDGSHIFHNVFVDLFYMRELVRPGGLVILDDCSYLSVATAVRYFEVNTGWEPEPIAWPTRLRAFRLPDPRPSQASRALSLLAWAPGVWIQAEISPAPGLPSLPRKIGGLCGAGAAAPGVRLSRRARGRAG